MSEREKERGHTSIRCRMIFQAANVSIRSVRKGSVRNHGDDEDMGSDVLTVIGLG
jgi:hypothetical protein